MTVSAVDRATALLRVRAEADVQIVRVALASSEVLKGACGPKAGDCVPWEAGLHPRGARGRFVRTSGQGETKRGRARASADRDRRARRRLAVAAGVGVLAAALITARGSTPPTGGRYAGSGPPGGPPRPHAPLALPPGRPPRKPGDRFAETMFGASGFGDHTGKDPVGERDWPKTRRAKREGSAPSRTGAEHFDPPRVFVVPSDREERGTRASSPPGPPPIAREPPRALENSPGDATTFLRPRATRPAGVEATALRPPVDAQQTTRLPPRRAAPAPSAVQQPSQPKPPPPPLNERERARARQIVAWANAQSTSRRVTSQEVRANYDEWAGAFSSGRVPDRFRRR